MKYFVIICTVFFMISCKESTETGDPKAVVSKFINAVSKKDMVTARSLSTTESYFVLNKMEESLNKNEGGIKNFQFDPAQVEIGNAVISGDEATVPVKENKSNETFDIPLKKQNGEWKVSLDISSMMGMAMKKMKEKGINITDSIGGRINKINIDSIQQQLRKKGISIDSVKNQMKKRGISLDSLKSINIKID